MLTAPMLCVIHYTEYLYACDILNVFMLSFILLIVICAECQYADCPYATCHYAAYHYASDIMPNFFILCGILLIVIFA